MTFLNTIPATYELKESAQKEFNDLKSLLTVISNVNTSGRNIFSLTENEADLIKDIAANGEGIARVRACNVISFVYGEECEFDKKLPEDVAALKKEKADIPSDNPFDIKVSVFPNPAKDYIEFRYLLPETATEGELNIFDITGTIIHIQTLKSEIGQIAVDTRTWAQGVYLYSLKAGNKTVSNQKFIITK